MTRPIHILAPLVALSVACGQRSPAGAQQLLPPAAEAIAAPAPCEVVRAPTALPAEVRETSGLARGAHGWWTHNDAGSEPVLYRLDDDGRIAQRVTVAGVTAEDWEDIEAAPCDEGTCLFVANIGDNDAERAQISVYRIVEPALDATEARARALQLTYPDGARDAEALFIDGEGALHIVSKGRREQPTLYRAPTDAWQRGRAQLEAVRVLFPRPRVEDDRVTAATATPDGRWAAVRTYTVLYLFPLPELGTAASVTPIAYDLRPFGQMQGESVVMDDDGTVRMTSEAESRRATPSWTTLRCPLPPR